MIKFGKNKKKTTYEEYEDGEVDEELPRKPRRDNSERKIWGFPCAPAIPARMKTLSDQLQVPLYGLVEHALQLSAGLITRMVEVPEENQLLRQHILEVHVGKRAIEKISRIDVDMAEQLDEERQRNFQYESAVRRIVVTFGRWIKPEYIYFYLVYGIRSYQEDAAGQMRRKD